MKSKTATQRVRSIAGAGILVLAVTALIVPPAQAGSSRPVQSEISTGLEPGFKDALRFFRQSEIATGLAPSLVTGMQTARASEISTGLEPAQLRQAFSAPATPRAESRQWDAPGKVALGLVAGIMTAAALVAVSRYGRVWPSR